MFLQLTNYIVTAALLHCYSAFIESFSEFPSWPLVSTTGDESPNNFFNFVHWNLKLRSTSCQQHQIYNLETFEEKLGKTGVVQESGMGGGGGP
jgi:hypothetical protein